MRSPGAGSRPGVVLAGLALLLGFLVTATVLQEQLREERVPQESRELAGLIRRRQATIGQLGQEVRALSRRLSEVQAARGSNSRQVQQVLAGLDRLRGPTGLTDLRGPGVVVELADSAEAPRTGGEVSDFRIQDVDLRLVVNALWRAGAEAVAVNGRRVTGSTAIREAAGAILVNFGAVSSPYRITAIGSSESLRRAVAASEIAGQFEVWREVYGLGFAVRTVDQQTIPGLGQPGDLAYAVPTGAGAT